MNWKKIFGALVVGVGIVSSPAVLDVMPAKAAGIIVAVAYVVKTLTGNKA